MGKIKERKTIVPFQRTKTFYLKKSANFYQKNDIKKAIMYLEKAALFQPADANVYIQLAIYHGELGEMKYSNELLHYILNSLDSNFFICHYYLGVNYMNQGLLREGKSHLETYLQKEPNGEFTEEAIDLLDIIEEEAVDGETVETERALYLLDEARHALSAGRLKEAIETLEGLIQNDDEFWPAYNNLAIAYFHDGNVEKAFEISEYVLAKSGGNIHAYCNIIVFLHLTKKRKEAQVWAERLKTVHSIFEEQTAKIGATFGIVGMYEDAYHTLRSLYQKGYTGEPAFYYWLSFSAYSLGEETFAQQVWSRFVEYYPERTDQEPWKQVTEKDELKKEQFEIRALFEIVQALHEKDENTISRILQSLQTFEGNGWFKTIIHDIVYDGKDPIISKLHDVLHCYDACVEDEQFRFQMYGFVYHFIPFILHGSMRITKPSVWAAAFFYAAHIAFGKKITFKEAADEFEVSVGAVTKAAKIILENISDGD